MNWRLPAGLPKLRRKPTWVAVHRVEFTVYFRRFKREEFMTLAGLRRGLPLTEALEAGFAGSRTPAASRPQRVKEWFANWAELGWICAPDLDSLL